MDYKYHKIVSDMIQFIHINLDYLRNLDYNEAIKEDNKLISDLYFLVCGVDELDDVYKGVDNLMKEIIDESKKIAGIEKMNLYLTDEEMMELDKKHYIEVGEEKKEREMIINMYKKNINLETISDISNLSLDKVQKIINEEQAI